jgi:hypothetical protein
LSTSLKLAKAGDLSNLKRRARLNFMEGKGRIVAVNWLVLVGLAVLATLPAIQMWHWVSSHWVPLPFWDEWFTPASQFESWYRGTLTWREMFAQHNESRNFFPRLLYFSLQHFGGWDVRKEMRVVFFGVCALCLLLLHLLWRTPGTTPLSTLIGWTMMTLVCFAPAQAQNFLYGIEIETFLPGFALLGAAAVNLSRLSFPAKALINLTLAFVSTYTFANGMLVWALAWPLPSPNESRSGRQVVWTIVYALAGAISVGCYFIGYHRPSYHPPFVSIGAHSLDLFHYIILWSGKYFATDFASPFFLGVVALLLLGGAVGSALKIIWRDRNWRTFYPWLLLAAFAGMTVTITALGRLGFGVDQALDGRYLAFSRFFYIALFGLLFALYHSEMRSARPTMRATCLTSAGWVAAFLVWSWILAAQKNASLLEQYRKSRTSLLRSLTWAEAIPDNPDLALIFPYPEALRKRALFLASQGVLRLPMVREPLISSVQRQPPPADGAYGAIDSASWTSDGRLKVKGWAWLPASHRPADCVVLGWAKDEAFKPIFVAGISGSRADVSVASKKSNSQHPGFAHTIDGGNLPPDAVSIAGWAIDLRTQQAWPLASSVQILPRKGRQGAGNLP